MVEFFSLERIYSSSSSPVINGKEVLAIVSRFMFIIFVMFVSTAAQRSCYRQLLEWLLETTKTSCVLLLEIAHGFSHGTLLISIHGIQLFTAVQDSGKWSGSSFRLATNLGCQCFTEHLPSSEWHIPLTHKAIFDGPKIVSTRTCLLWLIGYLPFGYDNWLGPPRHSTYSLAEHQWTHSLSAQSQFQQQHYNG